jgi:hypothetical protein
MNSVKCPRCLKVWYGDEDDDDPEGSQRLCSGCLADLRAAGRDAARDYGRLRLRKSKEPLTVNYFLIYVLSLAGMDLLVIGLAFFFPDLFGPILPIYGLVLFAGGCTVFRWMTFGFWSWSWYYHDIDWDLAKWPAVAAAAGLVCLVASARLLF